VVTVTSTVPALSAGEVAVMEPATSLVTLAMVVPNLTAVALLRLVPVIVTLVPPASGPALGLTPVTVGAATYVNWSLDEVAEVPPGVVTVTSTVPALSAGEVAVMEPATSFVTLAVVVPNLTAVAPPRLEPVIVTLVPPAVGPELGATLATVGAGT
jgi:hypothetical protein